MGVPVALVLDEIVGDLTGLSGEEIDLFAQTLEPLQQSRVP